MHVIDLRDYLDAKGPIAAPAGPARRLADFVTAVVTHAPDFERPDGAGRVCFKCRKADARPVQSALGNDLRIAWRCPTCGTERLISGWQGSFWDLNSGTPSHRQAPQVR